MFQRLGSHLWLTKEKNDERTAFFPEVNHKKNKLTQVKD